VPKSYELRGGIRKGERRFKGDGERHGGGLGGDDVLSTRSREILKQAAVETRQTEKRKRSDGYIRNVSGGHKTTHNMQIESRGRGETKLVNTANNFRSESRGGRYQATSNLV